MGCRAAQRRLAKWLRLRSLDRLGLWSNIWVFREKHCAWASGTTTADDQACRSQAIQRSLGVVSCGWLRLCRQLRYCRKAQRGQRANGVGIGQVLVIRCPLQLQLVSREVLCEEHESDKFTLHCRPKLPKKSWRLTSRPSRSAEPSSGSLSPRADESRRISCHRRFRAVRR